MPVFPCPQPTQPSTARPAWTHRQPNAAEQIRTAQPWNWLKKPEKKLKGILLNGCHDPQQYIEDQPGGSLVQGRKKILPKPETCPLAARDTAA